MPHAYTEDQLVEQPDIGLFAELLTALRPALGAVESEWQQIVANDAPDFRAIAVFNPNENRLSRAIAELLNPTGTHGQGSLFLILFLKILGKPNFRAVEKATVRRECCTYTIARQKRRIDIVVEGRNGAWGIGIENKPWAGEQDMQLTDYASDLTNRYGSNFVLLRLSGYESDPTSMDAKICQQLSSENKFCTWLYYKEFYEWLNQCHEQCKTRRVKNFIDEFRRYIDVEFGNKPTDSRNFMSRQLLPVLDQFLAGDPKQIRAYAYAADLLPPLRQKWIMELFDRVERRANAQLGNGWKFDRPEQNFAEGAGHPKFSARHETWGDYYRICIESQPSRRVILGIWHDEKWKLKPDQNIYTLLGSLGWADEKDNESWWNGFSRLPEPFTDWTSPLTLEFLRAPRTELEDLLVNGFTEIGKHLQMYLGDSVKNKMQR
jgi:hypothetical protein